MNANIDGNTKIMYALTAVKGVGRRYANIIIKKADIDLNKRAGELSEEEVRGTGEPRDCRKTAVRAPGDDRTADVARAWLARANRGYI